MERIASDSLPPAPPLTAAFGRPFFSTHAQTDMGTTMPCSGVRRGNGGDAIFVRNEAGRRFGLVRGIIEVESPGGDHPNPFGTAGNECQLVATTAKINATSSKASSR